MTSLARVSVADNRGVIAGRDIYLGDQYVVRDTLYFEPGLKEVEPPAFPSPPRAHELARLVIQHRLLVLAGSGLEEKGAIARHIAWLLRQKLGRVRVREWYRSSDSQKIETAFHEQEMTLLLLPQIQPHHLGYRLDDLLYILQTRQHYAIITTDNPISQWRIEQSLADALAWCDLSWKDYYGIDLLVDLLTEKLAAVVDFLPEGLLPEGLQREGNLVDGLPLVQVAAAAKKPDRIEPLVRWLILQNPPLSRAKILGWLDSVDGERRMVSNWYQNLDHRTQILVIGLIFFDGLPDDQVFAALESLVSNAWRISDPLLGQFDYQDLEKLSPVFSLIDSGADGSRIEMPSRQKRRDLLSAIWNLQRRRILATLPVLTAMIQHSYREARAREEELEGQEVSGSFFKRKRGRASSQGVEISLPSSPAVRAQGAQDLYGRGRRNQRFREAMIEAISEIGVLSVEAAEPFLLDLAVKGSPAVRRFLAKTLASWRSTGHSDILFRLLHAWWSEGCENESSRSWINSLVENGSDPFSPIRATVALAVGYAAQYDPPNQLSAELESLLEVIFQDHFPVVRANALEVTIPIAVAWHLRQLEGFLRAKVALDDDSMHSVAFGMAMAFYVDPEEAWPLLATWLSGLMHKYYRQQNLLYRELWISTLALAYGYIQFDGDESVTPLQVLSQLQMILSEEDHPFIRRNVLLAIGLQAIRNFDLVAPMLTQVASEVTLTDRPFLMAILRKAYLRQRQQMQGGDARVEISGQSYDVWAYSNHPLTRLEDLLYDWLDSGDRVARQVAVQAFATLNATDLERLERNLDLRPKPTPSTSPPTWDLRRARELSPLGYLATYLAVPREPRRRESLRPLLAEVIEMGRRRDNPVGYIEIQAQVAPEDLEAEGNFVPASQKKEVKERNKPNWFFEAIPGSWHLLCRWMVYSAPRVRGLTADLKRAALFYRLRWIIVAVVLTTVWKAYPLSNDLSVNLAFWTQGVSYESWVERSMIHLAEKIVEIEMGPKRSSRL